MPTQAPTPQTPPASAGVGVGKKVPEIVVIPEKFYGVALTLKNIPPPEQEIKPSPPPPPKPAVAPKPVVAPIPSHHSPWPIVMVVVLVVLAIGGGFVYLSRDLLFKKTPPPSPTPVASVASAVPAAPANLNVTPSGNAMALTWVDTSGDETGFRLERKEGDGSFLPLTNLPGNSTAFLDVSVKADTLYVYHVVAMGPGGESTPSNEGSGSLAGALPVPSTPTLPPGGLDSDSDGISDLEEPMYGTDKHNPDSDADGFLDGNEAYHLYNPAAQAPVRLLDSGLVKVFSASSGWSIYHPGSWTAVLAKPDGSSARIQTGQGESFIITLADNPQALSLMDWYLASHPGVVSSEARVIRTKGGLEGLLGVDRLEAFFVWDSKVFVLRYDLAGQPFVNYRTTFEMMLNSLKLVGAPMIIVPSDTIKEGPGTLTGVTSTTPETSSTSSNGTVSISVGVVGATSTAATSSEPTAP